MQRVDKILNKTIQGEQSISIRAYVFERVPPVGQTDNEACTLLTAVLQIDAAVASDDGCLLQIVLVVDAAKSDTA